MKKIILLGLLSGVLTNFIIKLIDELDNCYKKLDKYEQIKCLEKKANKGDIRAQYDLANRYQYGRDLGKDMNKAFTYYSMAARQGDINAQEIIYKHQFQTEIGDHIDLIKSQAKMGDISAQKYLAWIYKEGKGVTKDEPKALMWYKKASKKGDAYALNNIKKLESNVELFKLYKMKAQQGYSWLQTGLGKLYQNGEGVKMDMQEAIKWYEIASNNGDREAKLRLSEINDKLESLNELELKARNGDVNSQALLAIRYHEGIGSSINYEKAFYWYEQAAMNGDLDAMMEVGTAYQIGMGTRIDKSMAMMWFEKAAKKGDKRAKNVIRYVKSRTGINIGLFQ